MRKFKDLSLTEKIMLGLAILLLLGLLIRIPSVKKGFKQGWDKYNPTEWFGRDNKETKE